jgi:hypothetical protein
MQNLAFLLVAAALLVPETRMRAEPPAKTEHSRSSSSAQRAKDSSPTRAQLVESANGWTYVNGEWIHPEGYKFVNNKIIRTTAKTGKPAPKPPGKLALENPTKLAPSNRTMTKDDAKTAAEKAAETHEKNLAPRPAPQTGSHL